MHYQIVVCDDNKAIRDKIVKVLRTLEQEINEDFEIVQFASAEELLFEYSESTDILILDIQMLQMTGMQAAKELRKRDRNVQIIFLTALSEYAVEGYDVHAYSFLVKPVSESVLKEKVRSIIELQAADKPVQKLPQRSFAPPKQKSKAPAAYMPRGALLNSTFQLEAACYRKP